MTEGAPTNSNLAYSALKTAVLSGSYMPGVPNAVGDVARELGMSRTPIRVALQRLAEERLVEVLPRHGFRVPLMSRQELKDVQEVLAGLELMAIDTIHERCSDEEIAPLAEAVARMRAALKADEIQAWSDADVDFHKTLFRLSGNKVLSDCGTQFLEQMWRVRSLTRAFRPAPIKSTESHAALVEALQAKDLARAREVHSAQRKRSAQEIDDIVARLNSHV